MLRWERGREWKPGQGEFPLQVLRVAVVVAAMVDNVNQFCIYIYIMRRHAYTEAPRSLCGG